MAATLVRKVMLRIAADDGDTETKLDRISEKADELGRKHPDLKVKVDTAAAAAKLAVLRRELKSVDDEAGKSRLSIGGMGMALAGLLTGADMAGMGEMSMFGKAMVGLNLATGIGEPLMAGLTVAIAGLSSSLVAGSLGLGAYGLALLGPIERDKQFKKSVTDVENTVERWGMSLSKFTLAPIYSAFKMVTPLLKDFTPFVKVAAGALDGYVGHLRDVLGGTGFKNGLAAFLPHVATGIFGLLTAIGHIATGLAGIFKAFLPSSDKMMHGLDDITAKFAKWGQSLGSHSGFHALMAMFKTETPLAVSVLKNLAGVIKNVVSDMAGLSTFSNGRMLLEILKPLSAILDKLSGNKALLNIALYGLAAFDVMKKMSNGITSLSKGFDAIGKAPGQIQGLLAKLGLLRTAQAEAAVATEGEAEAQGEADAAMTVNPIGLIILAVAALAIGIYELVKHWKTAWGAIRTAGVAAWHFIDNDLIHPLEKGTGELVSWIGSHWKLLATILATVLLGPVGGLIVFIATHWAEFRSLTSRLVNDVAGFFEGLPGRIIRAIGDLAGMLYRAGVNAMKGLWNGLKSMVGGLLSTAASWGHDIISAITHPFGIHFSEPSEAVQMIKAGRNIAMGLGLGMDQGTPSAASAARRLGAAAMPGGLGAAALAGAGRGALQIEWVGGGGADAEFITWLKKNIRIRGGDPTVLGR